MDDVKRYISEALRIRRTIQVFSEFFDSPDSVEILSNASLEVSFILKRSMHDELILSLSRLFDSESYKSQGSKFEYLSQRNLLEKYKDNINPEIQTLRDETAKLWNDSAIKYYRDFRVAHNDKALMIGQSQNIKHNVTFEVAATLVDTSICLMVKLQSSISGQNDVSLYQNIDEKYVGKGKAFLSKLKT
jgi:hypothetical protein